MRSEMSCRSIPSRDWRRFVLALAALFGWLFAAPVAPAADAVRTLTWHDLLLKGEVAVPQAVDHESIPVFDDFPPAASVKVVEELDGALARLPGFVVPLDATEKSVSSLLLVPYYGACIHQPPPPPNQIVHVTFADPVEVESMYEPVWVTGRMGLDQFTDSGIAHASYSMAGRRIEKYEY